jgi:hypothetical protein
MPRPLLRRTALLVALGVVGAAACTAKPKIVSVGGDNAGPASARPDAADDDPAPPPPAARPPITLGDAGAGDAVASTDASANAVEVYAHSGSDLFSVDPQTLEITRVGPFLIKAGAQDHFLNTVTDIALDKDGHMTGITFDQLLTIDVASAECQVLAPLRPGNLNGLSWIRTDDGDEILAATGNDGSVLRIDPKTGETKIIGNLGKGQRSSGDLVSVANYGTLITLRGDGPSMIPGDGSDLLAKIDPATGAATVIGPTMFKRVYGLGFWGNRVFGFTESGQFILIDPKTGAGKLVQQITAFPFWGAGVSTSAPVIID